MGPDRPPRLGYARRVGNGNGNGNGTRRDDVRIADGTVHVYRLFDVADAVDLAAAERVAGAPASRLRLEGAQSGSALEFPRPPLHLGLGPRDVPLASGTHRAQASAHVYDYGVISVLYKL